MVRRYLLSGPFRAPGPFWARCCCMIWLMSYGGSDDPPQGISPRYLVETHIPLTENKGTPGVSLKDPAVLVGTAQYEPNAALLREPPDPSGEDTGSNPYSDLVAEPVPVPLRSRTSSPAGWWPGFATGLGWFQNCRLRSGMETEVSPPVPYPIFPPLWSLKGPWF